MPLIERLIITALAIVGTVAVIQIIQSKVHATSSIDRTKVAVSFIQSCVDNSEERTYTLEEMSSLVEYCANQWAPR